MAKKRYNPGAFGDIDASHSSWENSQVVVLPVPFERTTTYVRGTKAGPGGIIYASSNMELYDEELGCEPFTIGIHTQDCESGWDCDPEEAIARVEELVGKAVSGGKWPLMIGGEHTISIGAVRAMKRYYPGLSVAQLDAHGDLRNSYLGSPYNHACTMRRIREVCSGVQAGVRSISAEEAEHIKEQGLAVFFAHKLDPMGKWVDEAIGRLSADVYLTIDLDVFDPSLMPSTGTPEPGGLSWQQVLLFLSKICKLRNLVGCDIVELCPKPGLEAPDFTAAKLAYKAIGYKFFIERLSALEI